MKSSSLWIALLTRFEFWLDCEYSAVEAPFISRKGRAIEVFNTYKLNICVTIKVKVKNNK